MKKNLGQNGRLYKEKKCLKNKRAFSWPSAKWFSQQQQQQQQKSFDAKMEITKKCGCCSLIVFERSNVFFSIMMMMIAGYEKTKIILNPTDNVSMSKMMMMKVKVQCGEIGPKIYQKKNSFFSSFSNLIVKFFVVVIGNFANRQTMMMMMMMRKFYVFFGSWRFGWKFLFLKKFKTIIILIIITCRRQWSVWFSIFLDMKSIKSKEKNHPFFWDSIIIDRIGRRSITQKNADVFFCPRIWIYFHRMNECSWQLWNVFSLYFLCFSFGFFFIIELVLFKNDMIKFFLFTQFFSKPVFHFIHLPISIEMNSTGYSCTECNFTKK